MAIPTISTITPSQGRTGGRVIATIVGTNFRQYDAPATTGAVPVPPDPIRVTFGTKVAERVWVLTATQIMVLVPPNEPGIVDVLLENIDANGDLIPTETVTKTIGYTYKRPDLTNENPIELVTRAMIRLLKSQVIENVSLTTHTDFDGSPLDACNITELATLPAVILTGPRTEEDRLYSPNTRKQILLPDGSYRTLRACMTLDLVFDITLLSDSTMELLALVKETTQCVFREHCRVLRNQQDASEGTVPYKLAFDRQFEVGSKENDNNLRQASATVRIYGVDMDETDEAGATPGEAMAAEPSWALANYTPNGSVEPPDGVLIGTGVVTIPDGAYQLTLDLDE